MRKFLFLTCCVLVTSGIYGQKEFKGGILFGPVTSQISGDGLGGWDKFGFTAGAWVRMPISEKFGVTIQMKYITKGSRTKRDTLNFQSFGYYLNYIDVPILFGWNLKLKKTNLMICIGPYAGVLVKQKERANGFDYPIPIPFRKYDIGVETGVTWWAGSNVYFGLTTSTTVIPTRPNPSQTNRGNYYEAGNYNQTLQFQIGIRFGGGSSAPTS